MYIRSVTVENVKSFRQKQRFDLAPGVNFFVGDNNGGKSTVLEALLFVFERPSTKRWTPEQFYSVGATGPTRVEVEIADGVDELVAQEKFKVLRDFVFEDADQRVLRLERSSELRTVVQGGKEKEVDVRAVCFWHPERQQFENVTGIDAKVNAIFDFEAVWADADPSDHIDFATTKTLGRLLESSFKRFTETAHWKALADAHEKAFSLEGDGSFFAETQRLAGEIKALLNQQYGEADYRFAFDLPDAAAFMKQGRLYVDDGAGETPVDSKGTGMQRAITLGLIQLYARSSALTDRGNPTPLVLMLDEPETWLHPSAQLRLGEAISEIGEKEQVFIVTHSPYLIRKFDPNRHLLTVLTGKGTDRSIHCSTTFGLFGMGEPTWGEINYRAFGVCSNDFHNELYGHVQRHIEAQKADGKFAREGEVDAFLAREGVKEMKTWVRTTGAEHKVRLPVYVRNSIHHPENSSNKAVTDAELRDSTEILVSVVEKINSASNSTESQ